MARPCPSLVWSGNFENSSVLNVPGRLILPISPKIAFTGSGNEYRFDTKSLLVFCQELLQRLGSENNNVPRTGYTKSFPYQYDSKYHYLRRKITRLRIILEASCFACEPDTKELKDQAAKDSCHLCQKNLSLTNGNKCILHMSAHILFDSRVSRVEQPCAFCLRTDSSLCCLYFVKGSRNGRLQLDQSKCTCPMFVSCSASNLGKSTELNPATNYPLKCPISHCQDNIWRYNLQYHLSQTHSLSAAQLDIHKHLWSILILRCFGWMTYGIKWRTGS